MKKFAASDAATAAARAAAAAVGYGQRDKRSDRKSHVGQIDGGTACGGQQFFVNTEYQSVHVKRCITISRLVQSQSKTRTASAAGRLINADG